MSVDAKFDVIQKIEPIENSDFLELATVSNFPCVVRTGEFKEGDVVFYVRDDAKLIGWDELQERKIRDREAAKTGSFVTQDCFQCSFPWQEGLLKYLGGGGRVKSIRLRGKISMGILLKPGDVCPNVEIFADEDMRRFNEAILDEKTGAEFLEKNFGVKHWEPQLKTDMGNVDARSTILPFGLWKTDEENFQNVKNEKFPWNEEVLITKKLDGSSCSICATPDGDVHVTSRSLDLKLESDNVWMKAAEPVTPLVKKLAEFFGETIVVRGEVTGAGINASKVNLDCFGKPTFNMFGVVFPDEFENEAKRIGLYGTEWHFLKINEKCRELTGSEIKTVPVEGTAVLTRELLEEISGRPRSEGEGRVINTKSIALPHFKSKSKDYLIAL